jgi:hypothetical protein
MDQFPPSLDYAIRAVSNFFENSLRYSQLKVHPQCTLVDTGGKRKKSSTRKIFIISFGHLCVVELA